MTWSAEAAIDDFRTVALLAGIELPPDGITVEYLSAPHVPPTRLPPGKMAIYVFSSGGDVLKVGKVGAKSQARYTSQHYSPGSAMSTLAASILADRARFGLIDVDEASIGRWIRENVDRVSFVLKDLETFRRAPHFLENQRIYNEYPELACGLMRNIFHSDGKPRRNTLKVVMESMKGKVSLLQVAADAMKARKAL